MEAPCRGDGGGPLVRGLIQPMVSVSNTHRSSMDRRPSQPPNITTLVPTSVLAWHSRPGGAAVDNCTRCHTQVVVSR